MTLFDMLERPQKEGILYVYPEFEGIEDLRNKDWIPLKAGSREKYIFESPYGQIIAKKERRPGEKYREQFQVPANSNMTLKEISILRALSELANYEDASCGVSFEEPVGYFQGQDYRLGLFIYEKHPLIEPQKSEVIATTQNIAAENKRNRVETIKKETHEAKSTTKITKYLSLLKESFTPSDLPLFRIGFTTEYKQAVEIHYSLKFATIVALFNGVYDRDTNPNLIHYLDGGKPHVFSVDFEFAKVCNKEFLENTIDYWILTMAGLESVHELDGKSSKERRSYALDMLPSPLKGRIERYLDPSGYFEGTIHTFGPAYNVVKNIPMSPEEVVLCRV